jgi:Kef-type K+ transport system membrane component KefB
VPEVVFLLVFGVLLGPYVLNLAHPNSIVTALSDLGLTYLMFLAGTEIDVTIMRKGHAGLAVNS